MSKARNEMHYNRLYDHVLSELEFGRTENGINMLVGMLDVAELGNGAARQASAQLQQHPLYQMLIEDPLLADAELWPSNPVRRVNMLQQSGFDDGVSTTGRRLFAATSDIAFTRALRLRREHAERKLLRAWRMGQKIWLIADPGCGMMAALGTVDTGNITVSSEAAIRELPMQQSFERSTFDLVLAPHLPDLLAARAMRQLTGWLSNHLNKSGEFATSALLPGHPGAGWRRACFNWEPNCHDDGELARMSARGFSTQCYRDETGCVAWVEMRRA
jgi:hypothetical protein